MKRLLLALLSVIPFVSAFADENPAVVAADRNKEKWWADRHASRLSDPKRAEAKVVMLGDSITQGWEGAGKAQWAKSIAPLSAINLGFSGDRTEHAIWRIDNGELDGLSPKVVVIMLGTNNVGHGKSNPAQTTEGMKEILARIKKKLPATKVLLLGVFPRGATPEDKMRVAVTEITKLYSALADGSTVHFLDLAPKFVQPDGSLSKEIMPDLLHLSPKGYDIWVEAMLPKLTELLK